MILGVSDGGYDRGSSPYGDSVYWWEPMLFPEELQEVPGGDYRRIPAHTFPIPPATIARAWQLADALTRRRTGLGDQGADSDTAAVDETAKVQGDLLADWLGTGKRCDHPVSPFLLGAATRPVDVAEVDVSGEPVEDTGCVTPPSPTGRIPAPTTTRTRYAPPDWAHARASGWPGW